MEQRDQMPERPGEDIDRATAEAMAQAEAGADVTAFAAGHPGPEDASRSKRWFVVGGVTVAALALAGTAAGIAGHSHGPSKTTVVTVAAGSTESSSPTLPATSGQSTPSVEGTSTRATSSSSAPPTTDATSSSSVPKPSPTKTAKTTAPTASSTDGDCENTAHDTAADEAVAFSGMTKGTQQAFLAAKKAAQAAGLSFVLNSGYRSAAYQQRIFDCWVKQLGSPQAARKYALPPDESAHVRGYAMDIAPPAAAAWLQSTAGKYGLCRRYADETWHFEYQSRYKTEGCPALLAHP